MSIGSEKKQSIMSWYFKTNLLYRILVALVLGAIVGMVLGVDPKSPAATGFLDYSRFFGDVFLRLLKMIVIPVVFFSIVGGAASISPAKLGRVGIKIVGYYLLTSAVAVVFGLLLANITRPGQGLQVVGDAAATVMLQEAPSLGDVLLAIIPTNPVESLVKGDILPIIFFAMLFGIGISVVKDSRKANIAQAGELLYEVSTASAEVMYRIVGWVMQYAPIGVFVLIAAVFTKEGYQALGHLLLVTLTAYLGFIVHLVVGYGACLGVFGLGLVRFLQKSLHAIVTAFVTRSSSGTLPITLRITEERLGAPRSIASFSLPLGATINMDGTAIYLGVCAMFIGYATNQPLTFTQQVTVAITATLAAIGTAGVPGAGAIMLLMVMESIGLRVDGGTNIAAAYAMILGIDALLDMGRTAINVTGDMVGTVIVAKSEKSLDMEIWNS